MSRRYYAGIGARKDVPADTLRIMSLLANKLESEGWILRSGGAEGSDSAFLSGLRNPRANAEIYLPSRKFNNQIAGSQPHFINYQTLRAAADARRMVPIYHAYVKVILMVMVIKTYTLEDPKVIQVQFICGMIINFKSIVIH